MEEDSQQKLNQLRCSDDQVITFKITEQCDEDDSQFSQNQHDETEAHDDRKMSRYESLNKNKQTDTTQQSIQQINQNYNRYVLNQQSQQNEEDDNMNFSKNILSLHNTTRLNTSQLTNYATQNNRYSSINNQDSYWQNGRYSPFKYQIDAEEIKSKRRSLERETMRMEEEVKFLKQNLLSELYKQKQYENSRLYNLIYILYVASERNKKIFVKESFNKLHHLCFGGIQKADQFYQEKQFQKLYYMWNNWKNYMLDIKVNTLRQLVKQKMINTEKVYERQSVHYHNKKLKAKSFAGWFYFFQKNKELLARKRQRVNIHEIFSNQNSKDCSPIRPSSKNKGYDLQSYNDQINQESSAERNSHSNKKMNRSRSCKVCKVLDKKIKGNQTCQGGSQCKNKQIRNDNSPCNNSNNSNSASKLKQKLIQSLNIQANPPLENNSIHIQPGSTKIISVKQGSNPSVSPASRSEFNSRKPSLKVNNYSSEPQFFENKENNVYRGNQNQYQSPQKKLQEVIANAKSKILKFQNTNNEVEFKQQQQKGYLSHLNDDNDDQNLNAFNLINQQNNLFTPQAQTISHKFNNDSYGKNSSNDNIFATTLKKRKNIDENEYRSTGKIKIGSLIQQSQQNSKGNQMILDDYNPSPLKDSSAVYQNSFNVQKNIGQANTQDYYRILQQQNSHEYNNGYNSYQVSSPKFNTLADSKINFGQNVIETEEELIDDGYKIQTNVYSTNKKKNQQNYQSQNPKNSSIERKGAKQQQASKQDISYTTFKQRSNSISQYCKSKPQNQNTSLYSQITSRRNSLYTTKPQKNNRKQIQTDGFQFISPTNQGLDQVSNKSFYQETRSSSMKKRNDSIGNSLSNYFSQSKKSTQENSSTVFSFYHPTNSKNVRNLSKSPIESRLIEDEQMIEEQQNEYNPISFENSLRKDNNLNLSIINGSHGFNKSGFLDSSLHTKIITPKEQDKNLRQIEKRAQERKRRLEELKKKQQEWKKEKEDQERQNEKKQLEKERDQYNKEYKEYQAIKKVQKKNKKDPEELKEIEKVNNEKAIAFYEKRIQKMAFAQLFENHECHGKLDQALDFFYKSKLQKIFKALVNQTINEKDRQKIKEQAQLEKAINFHNFQQKRYVQIISINMSNVLPQINQNSKLKQLNKNNNNQFMYYSEQMMHRNGIKIKKINMDGRQFFVLEQQHRKCLGKIKIFTYESLVEKENFAKQREEIIMRTAFQSLFQQLPIKKKTEIDVDKVIKQFRKVVLLERCFRGWKNSGK